MLSGRWGPRDRRNLEQYCRSAALQVLLLLPRGLQERHWLEEQTLRPVAVGVQVVLCQDLQLEDEVGDHSEVPE